MKSASKSKSVETSRVADARHARSSEGGGGEKLEGFFTSLGAPGAGGAGEKPPGFFTTEGLGGAAGQSRVDLDSAAPQQLSSELASQSTDVIDSVHQRVQNNLPVTIERVVREPAHSTPTQADGVDVIAPRGGRPTVFTAAFREKLVMLLSVGMSRRQAAAYLGIDHTTVTKAVGRDAELAVELKMAEDLASVNPLLTVLGESRKNWRAAAWLLNYKSRQPAETSERDKDLEHEQRVADYRRNMELEREKMAGMQELMQIGLGQVRKETTKWQP